MKSSTPFHRSITLMATMAAMMSTGLPAFAAAERSGADQYRSRGKGKGIRTGLVFKRRAGRSYPFSSTKQDIKSATRQHTVVVNGFPLMQTRSSADRLTMSQVG